MTFRKESKKQQEYSVENGRKMLKKAKNRHAGFPIKNGQDKSRPFFILLVFYASGRDLP